MYQAATLQMEWCLECHRAPEKFVRPHDKIFDMTWTPGPNQLAEGRALKASYRIQGKEVLTSCSTCHR
jgi:mono/diheme cytochrome c family protein